MIEKYACAGFRYIFHFNDNVTCLGRSEHINSVLLNVLSFQLPDFILTFQSTIRDNYVLGYGIFLSISTQCPVTHRFASLLKNK